MHAFVASEPRLEGRVLGGRYQIERLLGAGAMGRVYLALHTELDRLCAVKVMRHPGPGTSPETASAYEAAVRRFRTEALAASRLDHRNIVRVLDFGREPEDGSYYLVTEHLQGEDLARVLSTHRPLAQAVLIPLAIQLCAALEHAHERGVVHCDLKPENVRLVPVGEGAPPDERRVVLFDFGTAWLTGMNKVKEPFVMGTPAYMSPEQASGRALDLRSDLYSCGVLLYEMATGRLPFERSSAVAMAAAHVQCRPPAPSSVHEDIDPRLESILLWCLSKRPEDRPASARQLAEALAALYPEEDELSRDTIRMRPLELDDERPSHDFARDTEEVAAPESSDHSVTLEQPASAPARRPSRLRVVAALVVAGLGVVMGCAGWLWVGRAPALSTAPAARAASSPSPECLDAPVSSVAADEHAVERVIDRPLDRRPEPAGDHASVTAGQ